MESEQEQYSDLPEDLVRELRNLEEPVRLITSKTDREIAKLASAHFSGRERTGWRQRPAWAAAAAAIVVAVAIAFMGQRQMSPEYALYTDVDQSGQVDIADVLALARESDEFTREELDAFAMSIVSLDTDGDSS